MRIRTALSCILASLLAVGRAQGASPYLVDYVKPKALLQLDGIEQSLGLLYTYNGVKNAGTYSTAHQFQERYHFGSAFTILDPSITQILFTTDLGLNQSMATKGGSGNGLTWEYLLSGSILQYDPYPINVTSGRTISQVSTGYLPTYTATMNTNQVWLRLLNKRVPVSLRYTRTSLDTEGLEQDSSATSNALSLSASNNYRGISATELSLNYNGSESTVSGNPSQESKAYGISGSNTLSFDKEHNYTLATTFSLSESEQADIPTRSANFVESFSGIFGKTLLGRASYQHSYNKTLAFGGMEQTQEADTLNALLTHQLFQSLSTSVSGNYQKQRLSGGDETDYGGGASLSYQKRLPMRSLLRVGLSANRSYVDRDGDVTEFSVRDELHSNVQQGDFITLTGAGNLGSVISVLSRNPDITYVEGRDYIVSLPLSRIEIVPGGTIVPGTDIFISYTLIQNPALKYYSDSTGISSSLSMLDNRYIVTSQYSLQTQHLVSGRADNIGLYDSSQFHLRFDANYVDNFFFGEYANSDSGQTKYWYTSGSWRYIKKIGVSDVAFNISDRYSYYDATSTTDASSQNEFSTGGAFSRGISNWGRLALSANYNNTTGDRGTSNFAFLRGNLQGRFNQLVFSLTGQTGIRINGGETSRNDSVVVSVSRSF